MAKSTIIGRVAVKVLPDTSDFRRTAQAKLAAEERRLKVTLPTGFDMTGARRDLLVELRKLNAENRSMDSRKIRIHAKLTLENVRSHLAKFRRELSVLTKTSPIKLHADLVAAETKVVLDGQSLDHVRKQLERWRRGRDPLEVGVKVTLNEVTLTTTRIRLAVLSRDRFVTFIPRVSKAAAARVGVVLSAMSGARMLSATFENIWDTFKNLDKLIPAIAGIGNLVGLLGASLLTASSNAFALLSSLASIAYTGLLMPGILGAFVVGLGVTITALTQFKTEVPDLQEKLQDLKKSIGRDFWKEAAGPIREMANELLPRLADSAKVVGTYFGGLFNALAVTFKKTLNPMFRDFYESVRISTDNTGSLAGVISKLGVLGASYLPRLATWFADITTQFDKFLGKADADGRLKGWVDSGVAALNDLGNVLKGTFDVFTDLGRAAQAAGGSTLGILAESLAALHKVTSGPVFQKGMAAAFRAAHTAISLITEKSGPAMSRFFTILSETLTTLLPIIGSTLGTALAAVADAMSRPEFQAGLIAMFDGIRIGVEGLAPVLPSLGIALGKLGGIIGTMAESFGPLLASALQVIVDVFLALEPSITPLIPILGGALLKIIEALAPALVALADALGPVVLALGTELADAVTAIAPHLADIADALGLVLTDALLALTPHIGPLVQALTDWLLVITPLIPQVLGLAVGLTPLIELLLDMATRALPLVTESTRANMQALGLLVTAFEVLLLAVTVTISGILRAAATVAEGLHLPFAKGLRKASDSFDAMATKANSDMMGLAPIAGVAGAATGASYVRGLGSQESAAQATARVIAASVKHALFFNSFNAGVAVGNGFIGGMNVTRGRVVAAAAALASGADNAMNRALKVNSPSRVTFKTGQSVGEGLALGIASTVDMVRKSISTLSKEISSMTVQAPAVDLPGVNTSNASGALSAAYGAAGATSLLGGGVQITVPMMPTNSTPEDVADALLHALRRTANGGVYA